VVCSPAGNDYGAVPLLLSYVQSTVADTGYETLICAPRYMVRALPPGFLHEKARPPACRSLCEKEDWCERK